MGWFKKKNTPETAFHNVRQVGDGLFEADIPINGENYTTLIDVSAETIARRERNGASINSPVPIGCERVNIEQFISDCMSAIPEDVFIECLNRQSDGYTYYDVPTRILNDIRGKRLVELDKAERLRQCATLNNEGIGYEKSGNTEMAIMAYEENIKLRYPARHSYQRLMILYHKVKDYENERRVIEIAIEVFPKDPSYKNRLNGLCKFL